MITVETAPGAEFQHLADKARELIIACQAVIEEKHRKRLDTLGEEVRHLVNMEILNLVTQIVLQAGSQELGAPRPALLPGVAVSCGMIASADLGKGERANAVLMQLIESFVDSFSNGVSMGLDVAARR